MPYISQEARSELDPAIDALVKELSHGWKPGDVNYVLYRIMKAWFNTHKRYNTLAEIDGVLSNVGREFYRRVAVPYEQTKIEENGDIE